MKNEFQTLLEAVNTTLKQTKIFHYPKQIKFSEEFNKALSKEVARHMQILDESKQPIRDLPEKFLKAIKFELVELTEKKIGKQTQLDLMPRKKWTMNPITRIHQSGKKSSYNRAKENRDWKKE